MSQPTKLGGYISWRARAHTAGQADVHAQHQTKFPADCKSYCTEGKMWNPANEKKRFAPTYVERKHTHGRTLREKVETSVLRSAVALPACPAKKKKCGCSLSRNIISCVSFEGRPLQTAAGTLKFTSQPHPPYPYRNATGDDRGNNRSRRDAIHTAYPPSPWPHRRSNMHNRFRVGGGSHRQACRIRA